MSFQPFFMRLHLRARAEDLREPLRARLHDPAWMLARQWAMGEFIGEDAGSPTRMEIEVVDEPIVAVRARGRDEALPPELPVETVVEREPLHWDILLRVRVGQVFTRFQPSAACAASFELEPASLAGLDSDRSAAIRALLAAAGDPVYDGLKIWDADVATIGDSRLRSAVEQTQAWVRETYSLGEPSAESGEGGSAYWIPERCEYGFELRAAQGDRFVAEDHTGGELDWYAFERAAASRSRYRGRPAVLSMPLVGRMPFPGAPLERYWDLEDSRVNLAAVDAQPSELAKLAVLQYVFAYSNDWCVAPLEVPLNSLASVKRLVVHDSFGGKTVITPASESRSDWSIFSVAVSSEGEVPQHEPNLLLLPARATGRLEGPALEEVHLRRDEMANMVWAVEVRVPDALGLPSDGDDLARRQRDSDLSEPLEECEAAVRSWLEAKEALGDAEAHWTREAGALQAADADPAVLERARRRVTSAQEREGSIRRRAEETLRRFERLGGDRSRVPGAPAPASSLVEYRMYAPAPDNFVPYLPEPLREGHLRLRRHAQPNLRKEPADGVARIRPRSAFARETRHLFEEEVPRRGVRLVRAYHLARRTDGGRVLWLGRAKRPGIRQVTGPPPFDVLS